MNILFCFHSDRKSTFLVIIFPINVTGKGAHDDKCSHLYHGPYPFSEPEVKGVASFLSTINNLKGFIDFHSYGQLWMTPWGYTKELPKDFDEQVIKRMDELKVWSYI